MQNQTTDIERPDAIAELANAIEAFVHGDEVETAEAVLSALEMRGFKLVRPKEPPARRFVVTITPDGSVVAQEDHGENSFHS